MSLAIRLEVRDPEVRKALADIVKTVRQGGAGGPMRDEYRRAAARFLGFIRRRFVNASRGDGTWPDLALSTKVKRLARQLRGGLGSLVVASPGVTRTERLANVVAGRRFAILRDTNALFGSLTEGNPGSDVRYERDGVEVGTAIAYAQYHQDPIIPGRPPQREIFVQPDPPTEAAIVEDLAAGLLRVLDGG